MLKPLLTIGLACLALGCQGLPPPSALENQNESLHGIIRSQEKRINELTQQRDELEQKVDTLAAKTERGEDTGGGVERANSDVSAHVARMIERCLKAKPKRRVASARELRRRLESLLGYPSPADCQAELARWLWERGIFEPRRDETVVLVADSPPPHRPRRARAWAAAAAVTLAAACITGAILRPQLVLEWTDEAIAATHSVTDSPVWHLASAARATDDAQAAER